MGFRDCFIGFAMRMDSLRREVAPPHRGCSGPSEGPRGRLDHAASRHSPSVRGNTPPRLAERSARKSVGVTARRSLGIARQRAEYSDAENSRPNSYHHHHSRPWFAASGSQSCPARTCANPVRKPGCVTTIAHEVPRELIEVLPAIEPLRVVDGAILPNRLSGFGCGRGNRATRFKPASVFRTCCDANQPIWFKRACVASRGSTHPFLVDQGCCSARQGERRASSRRTARIARELS